MNWDLKNLMIGKIFLDVLFFCALMVALTRKTWIWWSLWVLTSIVQVYYDAAYWNCPHCHKPLYGIYIKNCKNCGKKLM